MVCRKVESVKKWLTKQGISSHMQLILISFSLFVCFTALDAAWGFQRNGTVPSTWRTEVKDESSSSEEDEEEEEQEEEASSEEEEVTAAFRIIKHVLGRKMTLCLVWHHWNIQIYGSLFSPPDNFFKSHCNFFSHISDFFFSLFCQI